MESALRITILYPVERDGTVPMKPWKHGGGMAISRQQSINWKLYRYKGSSMTKKSEILSKERKVPDFGKQEETLKETENPQLRILRYAARS